VGGYWGKNHIRTLHGLGLLGGLVESDKELLNNLSVVNSLKRALNIIKRL